MKTLHFGVKCAMFVWSSSNVCHKVLLFNVDLFIFFFQPCSSLFSCFQITGCGNSTKNNGNQTHWGFFCLLHIEVEAEVTCALRWVSENVSEWERVRETSHHLQSSIPAVASRKTQWPTTFTSSPCAEHVSLTPQKILKMIYTLYTLVFEKLVHHISANLPAKERTVLFIVHLQNSSLSTFKVLRLQIVPYYTIHLSEDTNKKEMLLLGFVMAWLECECVNERRGRCFHIPSYYFNQ